MRTETTAQPWSAGNFPVAGLVLAAGSSTRLGRPKQLEPWGSGTLLERVLSQVRSWPLTETWLVLGAEEQEILERIEIEGVGVIINSDWSEGIASSLRAGFDTLQRESACAAALMILGDQPDIEAEVVKELIRVAEFAPELALVPCYRLHRGNPVLIHRSLWTKMITLSGDRGAKQLLDKHPEWVREVPFDLPFPHDIDTDQDVRQHRPEPN